MVIRSAWPVIDVLVATLIIVYVAASFVENAWSPLRIAVLIPLVLVLWLGHFVVVTQFDREYPGAVRRDRRR